jgi:hypothetical protein
MANDTFVWYEDHPFGSLHPYGWAPKQLSSLILLLSAPGEGAKVGRKQMGEFGSVQGVAIMYPRPEHKT